jgi:hypothetical protein
MVADDPGDAARERLKFGARNTWVSSRSQITLSWATATVPKIGGPPGNPVDAQGAHRVNARLAVHFPLSGLCVSVMAIVYNLAAALATDWFS